MNRGSNPFEKMKEPVNDLFHARSWSGRVFNYSEAEDGGDWADSADSDTEWTEDGGTDIDIVVEWENQPQVTRGPSGRDLEGDVAISVDPEVATFTSGDTEGERASEVLDLDSGVRYRVIRVQNEHNGVLLLDSERLGEQPNP